VELAEYKDQLSSFKPTGLHHEASTLRAPRFTSNRQIVAFWTRGARLPASGRIALRDKSRSSLQGRKWQSAAPVCAPTRRELGIQTEFPSSQQGTDDSSQHAVGEWACQNDGAFSG